ncbi:hypothetical protein FGB62_93g049 [Gracilaria domingensis]|nr:hypothetical protein FGB62_93g049 [Gracilaria domingensis]
MGGETHGGRKDATQARRPKMCKAVRKKSQAESGRGAAAEAGGAGKRGRGVKGRDKLALNRQARRGREAITRSLCAGEARYWGQQAANNGADGVRMAGTRAIWHDVALSAAWGALRIAFRPGGVVLPPPLRSRAKCACASLRRAVRGAAARHTDERREIAPLDALRAARRAACYLTFGMYWRVAAAADERARSSTLSLASARRWRSDMQLVRTSASAPARSGTAARAAYRLDGRTAGHNLNCSPRSSSAATFFFYRLDARLQCGSQIESCDSGRQQAPRGMTAQRSTERCRRVGQRPSLAALTARVRRRYQKGPSPPSHAAGPPALHPFACVAATRAHATRAPKTPSRTM